MKKFFQKLRDLFADKTDTWNNQKNNLPIQRFPNYQHPIFPDHQTLPSPEPSPREWRNQMINNEFAAQSCTQEQQFVNVFGPVKGGTIPCSHSNETFTENGLISGKTEALLISADGRLLKPAELHGGGKCLNCDTLNDKIYFCAVCKIPLCFRCVKNYRNMPVCHKHFVEFNFKEDTWNIKDE